MDDPRRVPGKPGPLGTGPGTPRGPGTGPPTTPAPGDGSGDVSNDSRNPRPEPVPGGTLPPNPAPTPTPGVETAPAPTPLPPLPPAPPAVSTPPSVAAAPQAFGRSPGRGPAFSGTFASPGSRGALPFQFSRGIQGPALGLGFGPGSAFGNEGGPGGFQVDDELLQQLMLALGGGQ